MISVGAGIMYTCMLATLESIQSMQLGKVSSNIPLIVTQYRSSKPDQTYSELNNLDHAGPGAPVHLI